jgi:hypothetical protein
MTHSLRNDPRPPIGMTETTNWSSLSRCRAASAIIPLAIIVVVGCIGEPIDIASGNPPTDNLIGAGIIIAAALPLLLLVLPRTDNR